MTTTTFTSGQKIETSIKMISQKQFESQFGTCFVIVYINEDGQEFQYKGTSPIIFKDEDFHKIKASIKLNEWNGKTTIILQRISLVLTKEEKEAILELKMKEAEDRNNAMIAETEKRNREEREWKEKKQIEKSQFFVEVQKYIGHHVSFFGWSYDNSGQCSGIISEIIESTYKEDLKVILENVSENSSQKSFIIGWETLKIAIANGGKFENNRYSNWGKNITIQLIKTI